MTGTQIANLVASVLGGGLVVGVLSTIAGHFASKRQRESDRLREQLHELYGPLWFFTCQNQALLDLVRRVNEKYSEHFERKWSSDKSTQDALTEETTATIELANAYVARVVANNVQVTKLLERAWHLVDPEDVTELVAFQVDMARFAEEVEKGTRAKMPWAIYTGLGSISYMRPSLMSLVEQGVARKNLRLRQLG
jgi:hypothetical protein